jgi:hypothetical protein
VDVMSECGEHDYTDCVIVSVGRAWLQSDEIRAAFAEKGGDVACASLHRVVWRGQPTDRHSIPYLVDIHGPQ